MLVILPALLTFLGGRPRIQTRCESGQLKNVVSYLGVFLAVLHFITYVYSDSVDQKETLQNPEIYSESNNIMRGIIGLLRLLGIVLEPALSIANYYQATAFCIYLTRLEEIEEYLSDCGIKVQLILKRILVIDRIVTVGLLLTTAFNILSIYWLYKYYYETEVRAFHLYNRLLPVSIFLFHVLIACVYLLGCSIFMNHFTETLKELLEKCQNYQVYNLCTNIMLRNSY